MSGLPRFGLGNAAPGFAELRAGNLGVRLAVTADELDAAQALRYRVFYQEMGAEADEATIGRVNAMPTRSTPSPTICWWWTMISATGLRRGRHLSADPPGCRGQTRPVLFGR